MYTYELYLDVANEWRWRLMANNGNNLGNSGDGYKNFQDIYEMVAKIKKPEDDIKVIKESSPDTKVFLQD